MNSDARLKEAIDLSQTLVEEMEAAVSSEYPVACEVSDIEMVRHNEGDSTVELHAAWSGDANSKEWEGAGLIGTIQASASYEIDSSDGAFRFFDVRCNVRVS